MMSSDKVCEGFVVLGELIIAMDAHPLYKHQACWECQVDEHWKVAVNGHLQPKLCSWTNLPVDPGTAYIEFNGWPAGLVTPWGGVIAAGDAANEDTFIAALRARIAMEKP